MSMLKAPKSVSRRQELREDQLATATARGVTLWEEHRTLLIVAAVALLVLMASIAAFSWWRAEQNAEAAEALGSVLRPYEQGLYTEALEGAAGEPGLLAIVDEYGSTDTGNLATFYAADALFQLGRYDEALEFFEDYDADDDILGASALAGQAAIHEQRGDYDRAARLYRRAAEAFESPATAPDYLFAAGRTLEAAGDHEEAAETYRELLDAYPESANTDLAEVLAAQAEALAD